ncbi:MAG TPA: YppF family protein [Bacillota bacterium]|nr:YppF family protein [Bacillota bacterium]
MHVEELAVIYEQERKHKPDSFNQLLDFYQKKYVCGEIDGKDYRRIYFYLYKQGAVSAYEY